MSEQPERFSLWLEGAAQGTEVQWPGPSEAVPGASPGWGWGLEPLVTVGGQDSPSLSTSFLGPPGLRCGHVGVAETRPMEAGDSANRDSHSCRPGTWLQACQARGQASS